MKKLKLKLDGMKEMLTKEQMKKISGGYGDGGDHFWCELQISGDFYCGGPAEYGWPCSDTWANCTSTADATCQSFGSECCLAYFCYGTGA